MQHVLLLVLTFAFAPPLGQYMARLFSRSTPGRLEALCYRMAGVKMEEMDGKTYAKSLLIFNLYGFIALLALQFLQGILPLNPQQFSGVSWHLAFNTAASFVTNTNWQSYSGETTYSMLTQMGGLAVQNFLSAATGMGALLALIRGVVRQASSTIGNFWVDLVRSVLYLFLPLSILIAVVLVSEGTVQTFSPYREIETLEKKKQILPLGPAASQVAIKQLGTNGGGFFNANSAHPFENPTPFTNFLENLAILLIPAASVYTYGVMGYSKRHAWLLLIVMGGLWMGGLAISLYSEQVHNPVLAASPVLEGKETRFGVSSSLLWAVSTTATSNGSVNAMLSSLSPLAGGVALFNIMMGEIIFGGVGVGLSGMIMFVLLTVFLSGLMVGRTPEYMGKKIEKREMQWVMIAILTPAALTLIGAGISSVLPEALQSNANQGPHGLSEILYAFSSAAGNNGSAFAGLNANTLYYNLFLGSVMLLARLAIILPTLGIASLLAKKKSVPPSLGTFSTDSFLFGILLLSIVLIVGTLTFLPALTLGPIVEHLLMIDGRMF